MNHTAASIARPILATTFAALAIAGLSCADSSAAALNYATAGSTYTQNFDTLPSAGTFTLAGNGPFDLDTTAPLNFGLTGWELIKSAGNGANALFNFGTGSSTSGSVYSFGIAAASDRSLGLQASGTITANIGLVLTNTTGSTLNEIVITFDGEQWRNGGNTTAQSINFSYDVGPTDIGAGTLIPVSALNFTSVINTATAAALDGNNSANRTAGITATIGSLNWTSGSTLVLQWNDTNDAGNDHGLAIDNFSFIANVGTPVRNLTWNVGPGTWNTSTANWTGDATTFAAGDNVTFGSSAGGLVTLAAGGVVPHKVIVSASSGTYTFQNTGGDTVGIGGGSTATLAKSGAGTLVLSSPNTYAGGTTVTGGTLQISNNNQLGAVAGPLILDLGGTLATTAPVTIARALTVGTGGAVLATNGNTFTDSTAAALNGVLSVTGAGAVNFNALINFGTGGAFNIGVGSSVTLAAPSGSMTMPAGGVFDGDLIINTTALVRFNGTAQTYGGAGKIKFLGTALGAGTAGVPITAGVLPNFGAILGGFQTATVTSDIVLNPAGAGHVAWVPGDVTTPTYKTASYLAFIGSSGANATPTLTLNGKITGEGDLFIASGSTNGGGSGTVLLNAASNYLGNTLINLGGTGILQIGVANALPVTTNLVFNSLLNGGASTFDLNGFNQQVASLSKESYGTSLLSIVNLSPSTTAVLTVSGAVTPVNGFAGGIIDGAGTVALVKGGTNKLTLSGTNTYSGGTTVNGGILQAVNVASLPGFATPGAITVGSGAALYVNIGGVGQWGDADIDALRSNATFTGTPSIGIDTSDATGPTTYISALTANVNLTKLGANTFTLSDAVTAASVKTLTTKGGVTDISAALGTGTSTVNARATTNITTSQTLAALNIGGGAPFAAEIALGSAAVPEPGTLGLLALGVLGVLGRRRR